METSAKSNFSTATDLADYLTFKGLPFRESHRVVGAIVLYASENKKELTDITLDEYKKFSELIDSDVYEYIDVYNSVNRKKAYGGTSKKSVEEQIKAGRNFLKENKISEIKTVIPMKLIPEFRDKLLERIAPIEQLVATISDLDDINPDVRKKIKPTSLLYLPIL